MSPSLQPALHRTQIALDKLPNGTVVLDRYGHAWQSSGSGWEGRGTTSAYWHRAYGDEDSIASWELAQLGPCRLLSPATTTLDRSRKDLS